MLEKLIVTIVKCCIAEPIGILQKLTELLLEHTTVPPTMELEIQCGVEVNVTRKGISPCHCFDWR